MRSMVAAASVAALAFAGSCTAPPRPLPNMEGGIELGVQRGSRWTTLLVKPPVIGGPNANLELRKGELNGSLLGRPVHLTIDNDGAHGIGPYGSVAIDVIDGPDKLEVTGTWSGSRVSFTVTPDSMRGTIPVYTQIRAEHAGGPELCLECQAGADNGGRPITAPGEVQTCQYVLDRVEPDGSRAGVSICAGMPERTRLEIPAAVQSWLTRSELVVVVLALLAVAPPDLTRY